MRKMSGSKLMRLVFTLVAANLGVSGWEAVSPNVAVAQSENSAGSNSSKAVNTSSQGQAKRIKYKKDTKVDFDDELIEGGVKNPFQSTIGGRDGNMKQGFIKIRREWHDQMIMSVNGLSQ